MNKICIWYYINLLGHKGHVYKWYEVNYNKTHSRHFYWNAGDWLELRNHDIRIKKYA